MNMFLYELKAYSKSNIIWTCSLVVLVVLLLSMFPTFANEATEFIKLMEGFPESIRKAIGLSLDSITSLLGYYSYSFTYISLCGAIQAMNLGTSIISKEVREKTADFLLTKPVTRKQIMTAKISAAISSLIITNIVYIASAYTMAILVKIEAFNIKTFFMISITLFFIQMIFLALGLLVSVIFPKIKSVISVSLGTVFTFFFIGMLSTTVGDEAIRYISPFKYFEASYIIQKGRYETSFIVSGVIFIIIAITTSYLVYSKKDIDAV